MQAHIHTQTHEKPKYYSIQSFVVEQSREEQSKKQMIHRRNLYLLKSKMTDEQAQMNMAIRFAWPGPGSCSSASCASHLPTASPLSIHLVYSNRCSTRRELHPFRNIFFKSNLYLFEFLQKQNKQINNNRNFQLEK